MTLLCVPAPSQARCCPRPRGAACWTARHSQTVRSLATAKTSKQQQPSGDSSSFPVTGAAAAASHMMTCCWWRVCCIWREGGGREWNEAVGFAYVLQSLAWGVCNSLCPVAPCHQLASTHCHFQGVSMAASTHTHMLLERTSHKHTQLPTHPGLDAAPETLHPGKPKATSNTQSVISYALSTGCCYQRQSCPSVVDCHKVLPVAANIHAPAAAVAATKTTAAAAGAVTCQDGGLCCSPQPGARGCDGWHARSQHACLSVPPSCNPTAAAASVRPPVSCRAEIPKQQHH